MTDAEFREAFHRHKDIVYRFAYRMTGSASMAEDVVQDCFVAYWRKPEAYDASRGLLRAFLLGVARNLVLKQWRRERPHAALDETMKDASAASLRFDDGVAEAVKNAVMLLPPLQREAVILADYEELSLEEIASATGVESGAVKSRLHRGRQNLRRMLAPLFAVER